MSCKNTDAIFKKQEVHKDNINTELIPLILPVPPPVAALVV